jgi:acyl dehydratase
MPFGRYFEELNVGERVKHWPGRTITEFDDTVFSLLAMNQHPLHIDEHYARGTQHGQRLVEGPLVISLVVGLTQADLAGRSIAVLEFRDIQHLGPVFHGDSIYAESEVTAKRDDPGRPGCGLVTIATTASNQRGEPVLSMKMTVVVPREGG